MCKYAVLSQAYVGARYVLSEAREEGMEWQRSITVDRQRRQAHRYAQALYDLFSGTAGRRELPSASEGCVQNRVAGEKPVKRWSGPVSASF